MNLLSFTVNFGSEKSCRFHFKEERNKIGVICKCRSEEHFWIKSDTIIQTSNLSFFDIV